MTVVAVAVALAGVVLLIQALFSLSVILYAWEFSEQLRATAGPTTFREPQLSFTALLPARGEQAVTADSDIFQVINTVW